MKLEIWLAQNQMPVPEFAKLAGLKSAKSVYRYIAGERTPERRVMNRIQKITHGQVTANDFYNIQ